MGGTARLRHPEAGVAGRLLIAALRRDRLFVAVGLAAATALAWLYLLIGVGPATGPAAVEMDGAARAGLLLIMWWAMMLAMMLPSAAPMILLFAAVAAKQGGAGRSPGSATGLFVAAYAVVWGAFSLAATAAQWGLKGGMGGLSDPRLAGGILVVVGLYQLTPWKHACLRRCRSPLDFLLARWRPGRGGAFVLGLEHGAYCLGCCWLMMTLFFAAGTASLAVVAAVATLVLVEKAAPAGHRIGRLAGVGLAGAGLWVALGSA